MIEEHWKSKKRYLAEWTHQEDMAFELYSDGWNECEDVRANDRQWLEDALNLLDWQDERDEQEALRRGQ